MLLTSGAGQSVRAYWGLYGTSKAALDALVRSYAAETENISAVKAMLFNPGPLRTTMRAAAMPGEDPMTLKTPEDIAPRLVGPVRAGLDRDRQALRFPDRQGAELPAAGLKSLSFASFARAEKPSFQGVISCALKCSGP